MATTMLSCKGDMEHRLKDGMVITVKGDTIKFYGLNVVMKYVMKVEKYTRLL